MVMKRTPARRAISSKVIGRTGTAAANSATRESSQSAMLTGLRRKILETPASETGLGIEISSSICSLVELRRLTEAAALELEIGPAGAGLVAPGLVGDADGLGFWNGFVFQIFNFSCFFN